MKDGGVFVRFSYTPEASSDGSDPMTSLQQTLRDELAKVGTLPTWNGIGAGDIWVVKGSPWNEVGNTRSRLLSTLTMQAKHRT